MVILDCMTVIFDFQRDHRLDFALWNAASAFFYFFIFFAKPFFFPSVPYIKPFLFPHTFILQLTVTHHLEGITAITWVTFPEFHTKQSIYASTSFLTYMYAIYNHRIIHEVLSCCLGSGSLIFMHTVKHKPSI